MSALLRQGIYLEYLINQWGMDLFHPGRREIFGVARRDADRARKRVALEQARLRAGADAEICDGEGNIAHRPRKFRKKL